MNIDQQLLVKKLLYTTVYIAMVLLTFILALLFCGYLFAAFGSIKFSKDILLTAYRLRSQLGFLHQVLLYSLWALTLVVTLFCAAFPLMNYVRKNRKFLHGNTQFATIADLKKNNLIHDIPPADGILMGRLPGFFRDKFISLRGQTSVFLCATPGTYKTISYVITNVLNFMGSCLVFDPKFEIFAATAGWRKKFSEVHLVDFQEACHQI